MLIDNKCKKYILPNEKVVDILDNVFVLINNYLQTDLVSPESGGYIIGYKHLETGNITIEEVTTPKKNDICSRLYFYIKDTSHLRYLEKVKRKHSYYMGVWHTHPQKIPMPSSIDLLDWNETLKYDKTGCEYAFFIIAGIEAVKIWVGDFKTKKVEEIFECSKVGGLYKKI